MGSIKETEFFELLPLGTWCGVHSNIYTHNSCWTISPLNRPMPPAWVFVLPVQPCCIVSKKKKKKNKKTPTVPSRCQSYMKKMYHCCLKRILERVYLQNQGEDWTTSCGCFFSVWPPNPSALLTLRGPPSQTQQNKQHTYTVSIATANQLPARALCVDT